MAKYDVEDQEDRPIKEGPTIAQCLDDHQDALKRLSEMVDRLGNRITPVLGPDVPSAEDINGVNPHAPTSPVMNIVRAHTAEVNKIMESVREMYDRVEL